MTSVGSSGPGVPSASPDGRLHLRLLPGIEHSGFSVRASDGAVACLRQEGKERSIWIIDAGGRGACLLTAAALERLADLRGPAGSALPVLGPPVWSRDGAALAFAFGPPCIVAPDGSQVRRLGDRSVVVPSGGRGASGSTNAIAQKNSYLTWLPSSEGIVFASLAAGGTTELREVAVDGHHERLLLASARAIQSISISPDGARLAVVTTDGVEAAVVVIERALARSEPFRLDVGHLLGRPLYRYPKVLWASPGQLLVRGSGVDGFSKHFMLEIDGDGTVASSRQLTSGAWEDGDMVLAPDGSHGVLSSREDARMQEPLWRLDLRSGERTRILVDGQAKGVEAPVALTASSLYFTHSAPSRRGDLYRLEHGRSMAQRLTFSDSSLGAEERFRIDEIVLDGLPVLLLVPAKPAGVPAPAVVWCHGGPAVAVDRGWLRFEAWLANAGFVVAVPAFRGSAGLGASWMEAGYGPNVGVADLEDVEKTARYLAARDGIDPARIAVAGRSWGGYLAFRAMTSAVGSGLFACGWAGAGITDWTIQQAETEVRYYDFQLLGGFLTSAEVARLARDRSPILAVDALRAPLLVTHGTKDRDVPFRQAKEFVAAAERAGKAVEHRFYVGEGHRNMDLANMQDEMDLILRFMRKHLCAWDLASNPTGGQVIY